MEQVFTDLTVLSQCVFIVSPRLVIGDFVEMVFASFANSAIHQMTA